MRDKLFLYSQLFGTMTSKSKREKSRTGFKAPLVFLVVLVPFQNLRGSMTKQLRATMAAILVISSISLPAQTSTAKKPVARKAAVKKAPVETPIERQIRELREQMQSQQAQIDALKRENAEKDAKLAAAQQPAQGAEAAAATASAKTDTPSTRLSSNPQALPTLNTTLTHPTPTPPRPPH